MYGAAFLFFFVLAFVNAGTLSFKVTDVQIAPPEINTQSSVTVSYRLSGSGFGIPGGLSGVNVELMSSGSVVKAFHYYPGEPGGWQGLNTISLTPADLPPPGTYTVRVSAQGIDATAPDYVRISDPANPDLQFANPRGVDVNRVPGSLFQGRIYVTEGAGGTTANRTTVDGVYVLNPDLTPAFPQPKATSALIGSLGPWGSSANSPYRPYVDTEGKVYITDVSDPHAGLFVADGNVDNVSAFFAYPYPPGGSRSSAGLVKVSSGASVYGGTSGIWVEGAGATRDVYTTDEDVPPGNSIWKRTVPAGALNNAVRPTLVATPAGADWVADLVRDSAGNTFAVSLATDDARKFDASGALVATLPSTGTGYYGICIDEPNGALYLATNDGRILRTDLALSEPEVIWYGSGAAVRDVSFDAEGWLFALNGTDKRLDVLALGDFIVADASATSPGTLTIQRAPIPGDIAPVGPAGLYAGENGQRYGDDKVDVSDAVYILRLVHGLAPEP